MKKYIHPTAKFSRKTKDVICNSNTSPANELATGNVFYDDLEEEY